MVPLTRISSSNSIVLAPVNPLALIAVLPGFPLDFPGTLLIFTVAALPRETCPRWVVSHFVSALVTALGRF